MKTRNLSFGLLLVLAFSFYGLPLNATKTEFHPTQSVSFFSDGDNPINHDSPYSYAARIKRFHRPYQGFDYFSPAYVDVNNYSTIFLLGLNIYNGTPYEYSKFEDWNRLKANIAVYRYYNDEFYRKRVDMWNRIYNPNWNQNNSLTNPFGAFNFNAAFGLAGNPSTLYLCPPNNNFYDYLNANNSYLTEILNGNQLPRIGKLTTSTGTKLRKTTTPIPSTPFITKKIKKGGIIKSTKKMATEKEDFYSHVTLRTSKRLPKNWRTLPSNLRAWYASPEIAPPSEVYKRTLKLAAKEKQFNRKDNYNTNMSRTTILKVESTRNRSPQYSGASTNQKQPVKKSPRKSVQKTKY